MWYGYEPRYNRRVESPCGGSTRRRTSPLPRGDICNPTRPHRRSHTKPSRGERRCRSSFAQAGGPLLSQLPAPPERTAAPEHKVIAQNATAPEATESRISANRGPPLRVRDAAQVPATRQSQSRSPCPWRPPQAMTDLGATGARGVRKVTAHRGVRKVAAHGVWLARHRTHSHRTQRCA